MSSDSTTTGTPVHANCSAVFNYGGGRQSLAIIVMILKGVIDPPTKIIMANTAREVPKTFAYLTRYVQPALKPHGMQVEIIPPRERYKTVYGDDDKPMIPMYSRDENGDGKFGTFCTGTWKRDRMKTYLKSVPKGASCDRRTT